MRLWVRNGAMYGHTQRRSNVLHPRQPHIYMSPPENCTPSELEVWAKNFPRPAPRRKNPPRPARASRKQKYLKISFRRSAPEYPFLIIASENLRGGAGFEMAFHWVFTSNSAPHTSRASPFIHAVAQLPGSEFAVLRLFQHLLSLRQTRKK